MEEEVPSENLEVDDRILFWRNIDLLQICCWKAVARNRKVWRKVIVVAMSPHPPKKCRNVMEEE